MIIHFRYGGSATAPSAKPAGTSRRASLLGLGPVVGKVFLSDMADLSGALRALSFIGLGAVLVGIGYAYRWLQPLQPNPESTL